MLDRLERVNPAGRREALELVQLQLADAVLGRDRSAGRGDEIVDQMSDLLALGIVPVGRGVLAGADVEVDVAVAQMAEAAGDDAGELALNLGGGMRDEARHVGDRHGNVVRERLTLSAFGLRNGVAELPECLGLRLVRSDHRVSDDPPLKRGGEQALELA